MRNNNIISIRSESYFETFWVVVGFILYVTALSVLIMWLYNFFLDPNLTFGEEIVGFLCVEFPIMILLCCAGTVLMWTKKLFEFNPDTKEIREGGCLFKWEKGEWKKFTPNCSHFAFQQYSETADYNFGGIFNKQVKSHVYDLRMIFPDNSFKSIIARSDFQSVAKMVILGNTLSKVYNIPFYDYVKELLLQKRRANYPDGMFLQ
jgi:hypothetical protein